MISEAVRTITGGHLVAKALRTEGVDTIFTLCGGHIIDIYDGCIDEGIRIVDVRHEQVAAHAADGYARMTGNLGCAVVTAGPGTTNAMTGVANAFRAESPMLLIGGQAGLYQHRMGGLQDLPHVDMLRPITKFSTSVPSTLRVADFVAMAAREAFSGAFGPVYLEIPRTVLDHEVDAERAVIPQAGHYRASTKSLGDPSDIQRLADILSAAQRPCVLLGQQVWTCRATEAAREFAERLQIPAYMNGAGRGTLPPDHPLNFQLTRREAFEQADVIVVVGTPFDFRLRYGKSLKAPTVVQIDMSYATVGRNRDIELGLVGDVGVILAAVTRAAAKGSTASARSAWVAHLREKEEAAVAARLPKLRSDARPIHPYRLAYEIDNFLTDNSIFVGDGGDVVTFAGNVVRPKAPGLWMDPGPLGSLGVGTGFAMAAKLAHPSREVVALFGDGSFAMTGFDMQTAVRFGTPYIAIVGNNSYMNQIRCGQIQKYGKERGDVGNYLGDVNFEKFADMLGFYGEAVREPEQIRPALERARAAGTCAIINVWLDPDAYAPGTENQTMYK
ncbi:MAG TPA: thiamine pyrophosphate-binding protein [Candidatus Acidoferrales bacterium]|nr:thiamine pyrophosphate-binding protein [Candidatus Acidoferrales bacterium]